MDVIRVCIGTEPKTLIAQKVLEFSIRRRTQAPVEFTSLIGPDWEYDTADIKVGTGFSLRRWLIPQHFGWQGRAIYMDADQLVLGDVAELMAIAASTTPVSAWMTYQPDKFNAEPWPQSSVMVIDCALAQEQWGWHREKMLGYLRRHPAKDTYVDFMHATWLVPSPVRLPTEWNHLNVHKPGKTKLVHFTKEPEQCWYKPDHPLSPLWQTELEATIKAGYIAKEDFEAALAKWGHKEDWRGQNGLHPFYKKYLPLFR